MRETGKKIEREVAESVETLGFRAVVGSKSCLHFLATWPTPASRAAPGQREEPAFLASWLSLGVVHRSTEERVGGAEAERSRCHPYSGS